MEETQEDTKKLEAFDMEQINKISNLADLRWYKKNGLFNNKVLKTCPVS